MCIPRSKSQQKSAIINVRVAMTSYALPMKASRYTSICPCLRHSVKDESPLIFLVKSCYHTLLIDNSADVPVKQSMVPRPCPCARPDRYVPLRDVTS
ncbi:hypothetical protein RRG08_044172 [Elysia crispata]|uniref:Uncharacterized protein n=1 Tax=Elysia crispata TaxID=231223 RepID=A0AAE0XWU5_9GAST|nr:hypothetical protein RRG08_044172 [Elysia crispata]